MKNRLKIRQTVKFERYILLRSEDVNYKVISFKIFTGPCMALRKLIDNLASFNKENNKRN